MAGIGWGCSPKEEKFQMSDNSIHDDEHYNLNTPLDETGAFEEAAASMEEALDSGDMRRLTRNWPRRPPPCARYWRMSRPSTLYGLSREKMS
jgi:hypothetical protein